MFADCDRRATRAVIVSLLLSWLTANNAVSQDMVPMRDAPAASLGRQLGAVGQAVANTRALALDRQSRILALRGELQRCGECANRSQITQQLAEFEDADRTTRDFIDGIGFQTGNAGMAALARRLNDPLGLQQQEFRIQQQESDRRYSIISLQRSYCYAITASSTEERDCYQSLYFQDFDEGLRLAREKCLGNPEFTSCVHDNTLAQKMRKEIATACSIEEYLFT